MLISVFIVLLLWHSAFMQQLNFTYTDEIITLLLGVYLVFALITGKYKPGKCEKNIVCFTIVFYALGLFATLIHNYQNSIVYGAVSGLFSIKVFICFLGAGAYLKNSKISKKGLYQLLRFVEIPLLPVAVLLIIDQFVGLFPYSDIRYGGLKCSLFVFTHPTELAGFSICSLILTCFLRRILMLKRKYILNYVPTFIMIIISGRYKALGFIMLFACVDFVLPFIKKFKLRYLAIGIPPALLIAYDQIMTYFSDLSVTARGVLYKNSFLIAKDYFPFGVGFGTYGTEYSRTRYSIVYHMYNMQNTYGLAPNSPYFICDTMWPAILGETGILGFMSIAFILYNIVKIIQRSNILDKKILFLIYALLFYLLIESVAETIFMNPKGCLIFIVLAFIIHVGNRQSVQMIK